MGPVFQSSVSYEAPYVAAVRRGRCTDFSPPYLAQIWEVSTGGGARVCIAGTSLGTPRDIRTVTFFSAGDPEHLYVARSCEVSKPNTHLECSMPPGVGTNHTWVVTIGGQPSPSDVPTPCTTGFKAPVVRSITGTFKDSVNTGGGDVITVAGSNFGDGSHASAIVRCVGSRHASLSPEDRRSCAHTPPAPPHPSPLGPTDMGTTA